MAVNKTTTVLQSTNAPAGVLLDAEQVSLKKKLASLVNVFAKNYFLVLAIDFAGDEVEVLRISEPVVPMLSQTVSVNRTYGTFLKFYCDQYVYEPERSQFLAQLHPAEIRRRLVDCSTYTLSTHHLYQGRNCPAEIVILDVSAGQDGSQCVLAVQFIEDIVRQQEALKKQDEMVKALVKDYNAIYHINLDDDTFTILQAQNVVNEDLYDYVYRNLPYQVAMDKFVNSMVRPEDRASMLHISTCSYIRERLEHEAGYSCRFQVLPQQGRRYFEMRILRIEGGAVGHFAIMTCRNVDEIAKEELRVQHEIEDTNKELAKALQVAEHANESKSNFISNVSHDMRTPLNAILGYDQLALETSDQDVRTDYLQKIGSAGKTLLSLINDILNLQKMENGVTTLHPAPVACEEIVNRVMIAVGPLLEAKQIRFNFDNSKAVFATINVDALRVEEIFINLLSNAAKFTPAGGEVLLSIACERETATEVYDKLVVRDNGIGISQEFLPRIFEPFTQERSERTSNIGGSGLGLSIVKRIVDLMHGRIEVKSALGKGTEFTVYLTFQKADIPAADTREDLNRPRALQGKTILLCEDNAMNREIAKAILEKNGMKVVTAANGKEGLELFLQSRSGDLVAILMDIRMPVMDGYEATRKIRASLHPDARKVPIIALSADTYPEDIKKTHDCGMNSHLSKPIDSALLLKTLQMDIRKAWPEH